MTTKDKGRDGLDPVATLDSTSDTRDSTVTTKKPEIDLVSWAAQGGKPSRDRRPKKAWRRQSGGGAK